MEFRFIVADRAAHGIPGTADTADLAARPRKDIARRGPKRPRGNGTTMKQRAFGNTGIRVGEIGLGCWQLGGGDWGAVSDDEALETLRAAADTGVDFLDTADVYGGGRSETLIGRFLRERRGGGAAGGVFVATKLGRSSPPGGPENFTLDTMRAHTEASLRRLGVDALDLTQLHCVPTDVLRRGEVFEHLRALRAEGKIKHFGASVESVEEARICLAQEGLASLQIIFNLFRQKPIPELFDAAKSKASR
jgi:aryl-alcohol dehydrogenase-like predicted oxidoreductase